MIRQSPAKIFLADQRTMEETASFRSFRLFNSTPIHDHYGQLLSFNDTLLAPGQSTLVKAECHARLLLLPLLGAVEWQQEHKESLVFAAGQLADIQLEKNAVYEVYNPFSDIVVNFLEIRIGSEPGVPGDTAVTDFDLNTFMNVLVQVAKADRSIAEAGRLSLGKFKGRGETVYARRHSACSLLFFVIEGAFEVEGRLLHSRDALALHELADVEIEALSNEALLLVVEIPF